MSRKLIAFIAILLFTSSCEQGEIGKPALKPGQGNIRQIYVLLSSKNEKALKDSIENDISPLYLVAPGVHEQLFYLYFIPTDYNDYRKRLNLLILIDKSKDTEILSLLSQVVKGDLGTGMKVIDNLWARNQRVVLLMGKDNDDLLNNYRKYIKDVRELFEINVYSFFKSLIYTNVIYSKTYQQDMERKLLKKYGWSILLPNAYILLKEREAPFSRTYVRKKEGGESSFSRIITIYKEARDSLWTKEEAIKARDSLGECLYMGDKVIESSVITEKTLFKGGEALRLSGLWVNVGMTMGGAFRTIAVYYPNKKTGFLIDYYVYAPGRDKTEFLIELETIIRTFKFED